VLGAYQSDLGARARAQLSPRHVQVELTTIIQLFPRAHQVCDGEDSERERGEEDSHFSFKKTLINDKSSSPRCRCHHPTDADDAGLTRREFLAPSRGRQREVSKVRRAPVFPSKTQSALPLPLPRRRHRKHGKVVQADVSALCGCLDKTFGF